MKFLLLMPIVGILLMIGCGPDDIIPARPPLGESFLRLDPQSLDVCQSINENVVRNLEADIEVLGFTGTNTTPAFMWNNIVTISNDIATWEDIPIEIPENGTFIVTVTLTGSTSDCYKCCWSIPNPNNPSSTICNSFDDGRVRFSGTSLRVNATPPPYFIEVTPQFTNCFNCGC